MVPYITVIISSKLWKPSTVWILAMTDIFFPFSPSSCFICFKLSEEVTNVAIIRSTWKDIYLGTLCLSSHLFPTKVCGVFGHLRDILLLLSRLASVFYTHPIILGDFTLFHTLIANHVTRVISKWSITRFRVEVAMKFLSGPFFLSYSLISVLGVYFGSVVPFINTNRNSHFHALKIFRHYDSMAQY